MSHVPKTHEVNHGYFVAPKYDTKPVVALQENKTRLEELWPIIGPTIKQYGEKKIAYENSFKRKRAQLKL